MDDDQVSQLQFINGDTTDAETVMRAVESSGAAHIIHLAGVQVPTCRADPRRGALVNVVGTINVFEAARRASGQVKNVVYASSAAVFGMTEEGRPVREQDARSPATHYGVFKRCNEENARVYFLDHGLSSFGLRPLTVYGVGRDIGVTSDITKAMKAAVIGKPYHIRFGGRTDLQYVADTANAFIRTATSGLTGAHVFNLHGETRHVAEVVAEIERVRPEARGTITYAEAPLPIPAEMDDTAFRAALGPLPFTPLAEGVRETMERFTALHRHGRLDVADLEA
jgi:nucleoside-diphosphate-sugar epimerase